MTPITAREFLPVELVFNPNWWYHTAGISFDESFYFDAETRIQNDVTMRRVLSTRQGIKMVIREMKMLLPMFPSTRA
ncbi:MAG: hypothetical protein ACETWG_04100 [Candidatus Neomarinimicrobiota bacterium]